MRPTNLVYLDELCLIAQLHYDIKTDVYLIEHSSADIPSLTLCPRWKERSITMEAAEEDGGIVACCTLVSACSACC